MDSFLGGHVLAFEAWGGVPRVILSDNLKSAVLERMGDAIRFNPQYLAFASHYRFEPRPVAVARGNEKGRVERSIRYIRDNFFAARAFTDVDDLNAQARARTSFIVVASLERYCNSASWKCLSVSGHPFACSSFVKYRPMEAMALRHATLTTPIMHSQCGPDWMPPAGQRGVWLFVRVSRSN